MALNGRPIHEAQKTTADKFSKIILNSCYFAEMSKHMLTNRNALKCTQRINGLMSIFQIFFGGDLNSVSVASTVWLLLQGNWWQNSLELENLPTPLTHYTISCCFLKFSFLKHLWMQHFLAEYRERQECAQIHGLTIRSWQSHIDECP